MTPPIARRLIPLADWGHWHPPISSHAGGCTFADDPAHNCADVTPIWSAAADPCVLVARAEPARGAPALGLARCDMVVRSGNAVEHVAIGTLRVELAAGTMANGPVMLSPAIDLVRDIEPQLTSVRRLSALLHKGRIESEPDTRFPRLVEALRALDARAAGASHRDIGLQLIGGSDWPGDGEYLKSRARRLVAAAEALALAGPRSVLAEI